MTGLAEWLIAGIAEDEAAASVAPPEGAQVWGDAGWVTAPWSAARVLAECEAKRRIVELHAVVVTSEWVNPPDGPAYQEPERTCVICGWVSGACDTVKALAPPYAGRDGYREEWRP